MTVAKAFVAKIHIDLPLHLPFVAPTKCITRLGNLTARKLPVISNTYVFR